MQVLQCKGENQYLGAIRFNALYIDMKFARMTQRILLNVIAYLEAFYRHGLKGFM